MYNDIVVWSRDCGLGCTYYTFTDYPTNKGIHKIGTKTTVSSMASKILGKVKF